MGKRGENSLPLPSVMNAMNGLNLELLYELVNHLPGERPLLPCNDEGLSQQERQIQVGEYVPVVVMVYRLRYVKKKEYIISLIARACFRVFLSLTH